MLRWRTCALLLILLLAGLTGEARARRFVHASGFSLTLPTAWGVKLEDDGVTGTSNDDAVAVNFTVATAGLPADTLADGCGQQVRKMMKDVTTDPPVRTTINDLDVILVDGTGTLKGIPVAFTYGVYTKKDQSVICLMLCMKDKLSTQKDAIFKTLHSVRKK